MNDIRLLFVGAAVVWGVATLALCYLSYHMGYRFGRLDQNRITGEVLSTL